VKVNPTPMQAQIKKISNKEREERKGSREKKTGHPSRESGLFTNERETPYMGRAMRQKQKRQTKKERRERREEKVRGRNRHRPKAR